jgi:hypothetical protein
MELRSDSDSDVAHSPPVICAMPMAGRTLPVVNCTQYRHDGTGMSCAAGLKAGIAECSACPSRAPLVAVKMHADSIAEPTARQMRGLGDLVERCIWLLFLGRLDVAQALAARMGRMFGRRRRPAPQGKAGGCGCKARQEALNRAIPFNRHAH